MTKLKAEVSRKAPHDKLKSTERELAEADLDKVNGGSFDIEQTLSIGSQSTGAGAGKVTFNPF